MFFQKNEVIQLTSGKKHLVVDTIKHDEQYYYYVCEVDSHMNRVINSFRVITTVNENNCLFVRTVKGELAEELTEKFRNKLLNRD
ncbi:MAG: hypothetical protein OSJ70_11345 [Bacilli bacterium]|nr:hypothetical protein [Bacilli bacterium]